MRPQKAEVVFKPPVYSKRQTSSTHLHAPGGKHLPGKPKCDLCRRYSEFFVCVWHDDAPIRIAVACKQLVSSRQAAAGTKADHAQPQPYHFSSKPSEQILRSSAIRVPAQ